MPVGHRLASDEVVIEDLEGEDAWTLGTLVGVEGFKRFPYGLSDDRVGLGAFLALGLGAVVGEEGGAPRGRGREERQGRWCPLRPGLVRGSVGLGLFVERAPFRIGLGVDLAKPFGLLLALTAKAFVALVVGLRAGLGHGEASVP